MRYIIPLIIAGSLIAYEFLKSYRKTLRLKKRRKITWDNKYIRKVDRFVNKYDSIARLKERFVIRLGVTNTNRKSENTAIVLWFTIAAIIISIMSGLILLTVFTMWHVVVILIILTCYLILYSGSIYLGIKLNKIHGQFAVAVQQFTDEYMTSKNIKTSLNKSYIKMPKAIGLVFEKLARELSSGYEYREPIIEFADGLSYVWGYAFAEILLMSYEGTGDITKELLFLNELISDELQANEEDKTEQAGNKMIFIILNVVTLIVLILNTFINPMAKELYFYTSIGNFFIMFWIGEIVVGITTAMIVDRI